MNLVQSKTCHYQMVLWSDSETEDARLEFLRLLLAQAGVQYRDHRTSQADWKSFIEWKKTITEEDYAYDEDYDEDFRKSN